ncbi:MAG: hypothetical protein M1816_007865 [Peltula sp. TS41687]|nr:MAG: hypothetical protein M1816_007865 [Peltula sp. TS41687]
MAEVGAIASVIAIAQFGASLSIGLYSIADTIGSANKDVRRIAKDIALFSAVLKDLGVALEGAKKSRVYRKNAFDTAQMIVKECEDVFQEIQKVSTKSGNADPPLEAHVSLPTLERLKWVFRKDRVRLLRADLESLKSTILVQLAVMSFAERHERDAKALLVLSEADEVIALKSLVLANETATDDLRELYNEKEDTASEKTEHQWKPGPIAIGGVAKRSLSSTSSDKAVDMSSCVPSRQGPVSQANPATEPQNSPAEHLKARYREIWGQLDQLELALKKLEIARWERERIEWNILVGQTNRMELEWKRTLYVSVLVKKMKELGIAEDDAAMAIESLIESNHRLGHRMEISHKVHSDDLSFETLKRFRIRFQHDKHDPDSFVVTRWVPEYFEDILWAHTLQLLGPRVADAGRHGVPQDVVTYNSLSATSKSSHSITHEVDTRQALEKRMRERLKEEEEYIQPSQWRWSGPTFYTMEGQEKLENELMRKEFEAVTKEKENQQIRIRKEHEYKAAHEEEAKQKWTEEERKKAWQKEEVKQKLIEEERNKAWQKETLLWRAAEEAKKARDRGDTSKTTHGRPMDMGGQEDLEKPTQAGPIQYRKRPQTVQEQSMLSEYPTFLDPSPSSRESPVVISNSPSYHDSAATYTESQGSTLHTQHYQTPSTENPHLNHAYSKSSDHAYRDEYKERPSSDLVMSDNNGETHMSSLDLKRTTYTKIARRHISLETLRQFELPYKLDDHDPEGYVLVKRWVPEQLQERLREHTRQIRKAREIHHRKLLFEEEIQRSEIARGRPRLLIDSEARCLNCGVGHIGRDCSPAVEISNSDNDLEGYTLHAATSWDGVRTYPMPFSSRALLKMVQDQRREGILIHQRLNSLQPAQQGQVHLLIRDKNDQDSNFVWSLVYLAWEWAIDAKGSSTIPVILERSSIKRGHKPSSIHTPVKQSHSPFSQHELSSNLGTTHDPWNNKVELSPAEMQGLPNSQGQAASTHVQTMQQGSQENSGRTISHKRSGARRRRVQQDESVQATPIEQVAFPPPQLGGPSYQLDQAAPLPVRPGSDSPSQKPYGPDIKFQGNVVSFGAPSTTNPQETDDDSDDGLFSVRLPTGQSRLAPLRNRQTPPPIATTDSSLDIQGSGSNVGEDVDMARYIYEKYSTPGVSSSSVDFGASLEMDAGGDVSDLKSEGKQGETIRASESNQYQVPVHAIPRGSIRKSYRSACLPAYFSESDVPELKKRKKVGAAITSPDPAGTGSGLDIVQNLLKEWTTVLD